MPTETEIAVADAHMQRITSQIEQHEHAIQNLKAEYWAYQTFSRMRDECEHDGSRFCVECGNNQ